MSIATAGPRACDATHERRKAPHHHPTTTTTQPTRSLHPFENGLIYERLPLLVLSCSFLLVNLLYSLFLIQFYY